MNTSNPGLASTANILKRVGLTLSIIDHGDTLGAEIIPDGSPAGCAYWASLTPDGWLLEVQPGALEDLSRRQVSTLRRLLGTE